MTWLCYGGTVRVAFCSVVCLLYHLGSVNPKPLPQEGGSVTQTGEPSHFQVDDKAAEIEVNANPAGVKVNAKPASLQVVAKPGTPAVPIFHPSIHLAQHYAPPPVIHRQPAVFFHGCYHFPYCHNWFYNGIKRGKFPTPSSDETPVRAHKSDIPRENKHINDVKEWKRQFISPVPQLVQPSSFDGLGALSSFASYGYGPYSQFSRITSPLGAYNLQTNSQVRSFALPSQFAYPEGSEQTASTRGIVPVIADPQENPDVLRGFEKLYKELNRLKAIYNDILRQGSHNTFQSLGYGSGMDLNGARSSSAVRGGLNYVPSNLQTVQYVDPMSLGKLYLPSQLSQLYAPQGSLMQSNGITGSSLGEQAISPYVALSPMLQGMQLVGRSKVPGQSAKKTKKRKGFMKGKKKVKRQAIVEPIVPEEQSDVDDLIQDGLSQDYKRQLIFAPALETAAQQYQPFPSSVLQETLHPQIGQLQLQQLMEQQSLVPQNVGLQPMRINSVPVVQTGGMQQLGMSGSQQLGNFLPLESAPLRYLAPSVMSSIEALRSRLTGRSSPLMSSSLVPSSLISPLLFSGLSQPRNALGSIQDFSSGSLFQGRPVFRQPSRYGFQRYTRRSLLRPQYRKQLDNIREEHLRALEPEILGKEEITTPGTYTTERVPSSEGETLINSSVGFGPITVEAKTAEGARAEEAGVEDKRESIAKPFHSNNKRPLKKKL